MVEGAGFATLRNVEIVGAAESTLVDVKRDILDGFRAWAVAARTLTWLMDGSKNGSTRDAGSSSCRPTPPLRRILILSALPCRRR